MAGQGTAALRRPTIAGLRILLVEDEAMLGLLFSVMIESLGHVVCGVATTETGAVQAAADLNPDLMIVDVGLGRGDGVAAMA